MISAQRDFRGLDSYFLERITVNIFSMAFTVEEEDKNYEIGASLSHDKQPLTS